MTPRQVHAALKKIAGKIAYAAEHGITQRNHYDRMVAAIREGEKAHQRFRPDSCPREITLGQATNWFICRCTVDALEHPSRTVDEMAHTREDYVAAAFMVACDRERFESAVTAEDRAIIAEHDYPRMDRKS